ncbi:hypothetical protein WJX73_004258 [Symbiochloris irregularis]|uniref:GATA-type domain-containing protein n=1 Tax=Symbiochloris irregularis TaxID=706552 RepID=A0AAW1PVH0_9CHLO
MLAARFALYGSLGTPTNSRCDSDTTLDSDLQPIDSLRPRFSDGSIGESEVSQEYESSRSLFCLALVNADTGEPERIATPHEALAVSRVMAAESGQCTSGDEDSEQPAPDYAYVSSNPLCRIGGPCRHCGARDSPQWRKGPPSKPILCNACGTRFRRTHQLMHLYGGGRKLLSATSGGSPAPSTPRKRCGGADLRPSPSPKRLHAGTAFSPTLARRTSSLSATSAALLDQL